MKPKSFSEANGKGGSSAPAFVLCGLLALMILVPDTQLLDLKRALGFFFLAAFALALTQAERQLFPNRFGVAFVALGAAFYLAWVLSPFPSAASFRKTALWLFLGMTLVGASSPKNWLNALGFAWLNAALAVALYALVQRVGFDPISAYAAAGSGQRAMGSFGNANFLAGFLCLSWPLALLWHGWKRHAAGALFMAALLATQSRAGMLALAAQLAILGFQAWREGLRPKLSWFVFTGFFMTLGLWLFPLQSWLRPTWRGPLWLESVELWWQRPWVGWGPGSFPLAFQSQPNALQFAEHPHNWILSILCEAGLLGLGAFIAMLFLVRPWPLFQIERSPLQRALAFGALGCLIQNFFDRNLDQAGVGAFFFLSLGILIPSNEFKRSKANPWLFWMITPVLLWVGLRPLLDYRSAVESPMAAAVPSAKMADAGNDAAAWDRQGAAMAAKGVYHEAAGAYARALQLAPTRGRAQNLGNCWMMLGKPVEAEQAFKQAVELDPTSSDAHFSLGYALFSQKRLREAVAELDEALRLDPDNASARKLKEQMLR
jgi:tetratricopeptide (TPR) repeat protein